MAGVSPIVKNSTPIEPSKSIDPTTEKLVVLGTGKGLDLSRKEGTLERVVRRLLDGERILLITSSKEERKAIMSSLEKLGLESLAIPFSDKSDYKKSTKERIWKLLEHVPLPDKSLNEIREKNSIWRARVKEIETILKSPVGNTGMSLSEFANELSKIRDKGVGFAEILDKECKVWTKEKADRVINLAKELDISLPTLTSDEVANTSGIQRSIAKGDNTQSIYEAIESTEGAILRVIEAIRPIMTELSLPHDISPNSLRDVLSSFVIIDQIYSKGGEFFGNLPMNHNDDNFNVELIQKLISFSDNKVIQSRLKEGVLSEIDDSNLESKAELASLRRSLSEFDSSWEITRSFSPTYRELVSRVTSMVPNSKNLTHESLSKLVESLIDYRDSYNHCRTIEVECKVTEDDLNLPLRTRGDASDSKSWEFTSKFCQKTVDILTGLRSLPCEKVRSLLGDPEKIYDLSDKISSTINALGECQHAFERLSSELRLDYAAKNGLSTELPLESIRDKLLWLKSNPESLDKRLNLNSCRTELKAQGSEWLMDSLIGDPSLRGNFGESLRASWLITLARNHIESHPHISKLSEDQLARLSQVYDEAKLELLKGEASEVALTYALSVPRAEFGGEALVFATALRSSTSIGDLSKAAPNVLKRVTRLGIADSTKLENPLDLQAMDFTRFLMSPSIATEDLRRIESAFKGKLDRARGHEVLRETKPEVYPVLAKDERHLSLFKPIEIPQYRRAMLYNPELKEAYLEGQISLDLLRKSLLEVIEREGPIDSNFISKRIAQSMDAKKLPPRLKDKAEDLLLKLLQDGDAYLQNGYYSLKKERFSVPRDRSNEKGKVRHFNNIPRTELDGAILITAFLAGTIEERQLIPKVINIFGYSGTPDGSEAILQKRIELLKHEGHLRDDRGVLSIGKSSEDALQVCDQVINRSDDQRGN